MKFLKKTHFCYIINDNILYNRYNLSLIDNNIVTKYFYFLYLKLPKIQMINLN